MVSTPANGNQKLGPYKRQNANTPKKKTPKIIYFQTLHPYTELFGIAAFLLLNCH